MLKKARLKLTFSDRETPIVAKGDKVKKGDILVKSKTHELDEFNLAQILDVPTKKVERYLVVKDNEVVKIGQVIAVKKNVMSQKSVKAPAAGTFVIINRDKGIVGIKHEVKASDLKAWFDGIIEEVAEDTILCEVAGLVFDGTDGKGIPVSGKLTVVTESISTLTMPTDIENRILAVKVAKSDLIAKADALGVVALVAESLEQPSFSLPYLIVENIDSLHPHREKMVIVYGDEKQLLVIDEGGHRKKESHGQ